MTDSNNTVVIEAEDMARDDYDVVSGHQASGGELVKISGHDGSLSTSFGGASGSYEMTVFAQDETDGVSTIEVVVNGQVVGLITLDQQTDGGGSNNSGFTGFTLDENIELSAGDEIEIRGYKDGGEYVRIDRVELVQQAETGEWVTLLFESFDGNSVAESENVVSSDFVEIDDQAVTSGHYEGATLFRAVDMTGFTEGSITFGAEVVCGGFEAWGYNNGDFFRVELVAASGEVIELDTFTGWGNTLTGTKTGQTITEDFGDLSYDIPENIGEFQLRFVSDISAGSEKIGIDDVRIAAKKAGAPSDGGTTGSTETMVCVAEIAQAELKKGATLVDGKITFDGHNDYAVIAADDSFQLDAGTIALSFNAEDLDDDGTLVSRDSSGYDGGGHLNIEVEDDGRIEVRLQSDRKSYEIETGKGTVKEGVDYDLAFSFGAEGMKLYLNGELVGSNHYTGGIAGNDEPITLGASQSKSGNGTANELRDFFEGKIWDFKLVEGQFTPEELEAGGDEGGSGDPAPIPVDAIDDMAMTDEDTPIDPINVLDNDLPSDGELTIVSVEGGELGETISVTTEGGRVADVVLNADGTFTFDPDGGFEDLDTGEQDSFTIDYTIEGPGAEGELPKHNIMFVVDISNSTSPAEFEGAPVGDQNGDGVANSVLDAEIAAYKALIDQIEASGLPADKVDIGLTVFSGNDDFDSNDWKDSQFLGTYKPGDAALVDALENLSDSGWTNFEAPLQKTVNWFVEQGATTEDKNVVYFLSDGAQNRGGAFDDEAAELHSVFGAEIHAVGVGEGAVLDQLNVIDNTGGAEIVTNTDDLKAAMVDTVDMTPGGRDTATIEVVVEGVDDLPPVAAVEDEVCVEEDGPAETINILANDDARLVTVTGIEGGAIGESFAVTTDGGRTGFVTVQADGTFTFDPGPDFDPDNTFNTGDTDTVTLTYTAATESAGTEAVEKVISFDGLGHGSDADEINAALDGVTVTAKRGSGASANDAMIFDTGFTGSTSDKDLLVDGQGNALIISEDNDSNDPDDNAHGGTITLDFDSVVTLNDITFIDTERDVPSVKFFDESGALITTLDGPETANGGKAVGSFDVAGVKSVEVSFMDSGAIDDIRYTEEAAGEAEEVTSTVAVTIKGNDDNLLPGAQDDFIEIGEAEVIGTEAGEVAYNVVTGFSRDGIVPEQADIPGDGPLTVVTVENLRFAGEIDGNGNQLPANVTTLDGEAITGPIPVGETVQVQNNNLFLPAIGLLTVNADGSVDFDVTEQSEGFLLNGDNPELLFDYTVADEDGDQAGATATIRILGETPPNLLPDALDDFIEIGEAEVIGTDDGEVGYNLITGFAGDGVVPEQTDIPGDGPLSVVTVENLRFAGEIDGNGNQLSANVTTLDGMPVTGPIPIGEPVQVQNNNIFLPAIGILTVNADGSVDFDVTEQSEGFLFTGNNPELLFDYTVADENNDTDTATATIRIVGETPPDLIPDAQDDAIEILENEVIGSGADEIAFNLITGQVGDTVVSASIDTPGDGDLTVITATNLRFVGENDASGNPLPAQIRDADGNKITGPIPLDTPVTVQNNNLFLPLIATMVVGSDGSVSFDVTDQSEGLLFAGTNPTLLFDYIVADEDGDTDAAGVSIQIEGVNPPDIQPIANDDRIEIGEATVIGTGAGESAYNLITGAGSVDPAAAADIAGNGAITLTTISGIQIDGEAAIVNGAVPSGTQTFAPGTSLSVSNASGTVAGTLTVTAAGVVAFDLLTEDQLFEGDVAPEVTFTYAIRDNDFDTDSAVATIAITPSGIPDVPPLANPDQISIGEDDVIGTTGTVQANLVSGATGGDAIFDVQADDEAGDGPLTVTAIEDLNVFVLSGGEVLTVDPIASVEIVGGVATADITTLNLAGETVTLGTVSISDSGELGVELTEIGRSAIGDGDGVFIDFDYTVEDTLGLTSTAEARVNIAGEGTPTSIEDPTPSDFSVTGTLVAPPATPGSVAIAVIVDASSLSLAFDAPYNGDLNNDFNPSDAFDYALALIVGYAQEVAAFDPDQEIAFIPVGATVDFFAQSPLVGELAGNGVLTFRAGDITDAIDGTGAFAGAGALADPLGVDASTLGSRVFTEVPTQLDLVGDTIGLELGLQQAEEFLADSGATQKEAVTVTFTDGSGANFIPGAPPIVPDLADEVANLEAIDADSNVVFIGNDTFADTALLQNAIAGEGDLILNPAAPIDLIDLTEPVGAEVGLITDFTIKVNGEVAFSASEANQVGADFSLDNVSLAVEAGDEVQAFVETDGVDPEDAFEAGKTQISDVITVIGDEDSFAFNFDSGLIV